MLVGWVLDDRLLDDGLSADICEVELGLIALDEAGFPVAMLLPERLADEPGDDPSDGILDWPLDVDVDVPVVLNWLVIEFIDWLPCETLLTVSPGEVVGFKVGAEFVVALAVREVEAAVGGPVIPDAVVELWRVTDDGRPVEAELVEDPTVVLGTLLEVGWLDTVPDTCGNVIEIDWEPKIPLVAIGEVTDEPEVKLRLAEGDVGVAEAEEMGVDRSIFESLLDTLVNNIGDELKLLFCELLGPVDVTSTDTEPLVAGNEPVGDIFPETEAVEVIPVKTKPLLLVAVLVIIVEEAPVARDELGAVEPVVDEPVVDGPVPVVDDEPVADELVPLLDEADPVVDEPVVEDPASEIPLAAGLEEASAENLMIGLLAVPDDVGERLDDGAPEAPATILEMPGVLENEASPELDTTELPVLTSLPKLAIEVVLLTIDDFGAEAPETTPLLTEVPGTLNSKPEEVAEIDASPEIPLPTEVLVAVDSEADGVAVIDTGSAGDDAVRPAEPVSTDPEEPGVGTADRLEPRSLD
ncbi:hypothetical protein F5Y16DRAFT_400213 [Xylariaceae sp. FL0255]|nr:hypothetical protein F5Y16DRAFT_400213 [Xylariaceae sp. FL0255]